MLTADQVEVRRRADQLYLKPLADEDRPRALALGEAYLGLARAHLGRERGQLLEACRQIPVTARDRKLAAGLLKLVLDRCQFEETDRRRSGAGAGRAVHPSGGGPAPDKRAGRPRPGSIAQAVVAETAQALGMTAEAAGGRRCTPTCPRPTG